jgi:hypothetical protein
VKIAAAQHIVSVDDTAVDFMRWTTTSGVEPHYLCAFLADLLEEVIEE